MRISKDSIVFLPSDFHFIKKVGPKNAVQMVLAHTATHKTPFIYDLPQLADFLHGHDRPFFSVLRRVDQQYTPITIKKPNGESRIVFSPSGRLRFMQHRILSQILRHYPVSKYATAYIKGRRLFDNAQPHTGQKYLLKLDITNFFGSISARQILCTVFNKHFFPTPVGIALTNLCCYKGALAQGAPSSPMLSNLIMKHFDDTMGVWCENNRINYTRYCDDITFSSDKPLYHAYSKACSLLKKMGFKPNERKTHFVANTRRQTVTGLTVNQKVSVPTEYKRRLRQKLYYFFKYDTDDFGYKNSQISYAGYLHSLLGQAGYVLSIEPSNRYFEDAKHKLLDILYETEIFYDKPDYEL